jgi:hypothetical protein
MKIRAFWNIVPCHLALVDQRFGGVYCLHHQGNERMNDGPDDESSTHLWNVGLLRDCTALYPTWLQSSKRYEYDIIYTELSENFFATLMFNIIPASYISMWCISSGNYHFWFTASVVFLANSQWLMAPDPETYFSLIMLSIHNFSGTSEKFVIAYSSWPWNILFFSLSLNLLHFWHIMKMFVHTTC